MPRPARTHWIESKRELVALASPIRQQIADVLIHMGRASAAEIAGALGRPADSLYYHLRALQRVGIVLAAGSRTRGGRKEELFRAVARELALRYDPSSATNVRAVTRIVGAMLRLGLRDFRRALVMPGVVVAGPRRELRAIRVTGWLAPRDVAGVRRRIRELIHAVSGPRQRGRLYAITVVLTPLARRTRAARRATPAKRRKGASGAR